MKKKKESSAMLWVHICIAFLLIVLIGMILFFGKKFYKQNQMMQQNVAPQIISANFVCTGDKKIMANFFDNKVELTLPDGRNLLLLTALSGSGVRYTNWDESVTFWNEGDTAFMEEGPTDTVTYADCVQSKTAN
ncbi:MAG: MliC family protein [Candidatus Levybacteria bacterium]|nr:MliC family protein [Candidatus Levybacteria bacterium]